MGMQTDVLSYHASSSSLAYNGRTRLKGVVLSPVVSVVYNSLVLDTAGSLTGTYDIPNSTVCTVTIADHGLANGARVGLDFTSGTGIDNAYVVENSTTNTFTVTTGTANTSGNATVYPNVLVELDSASGVSFYTLIPGEGILAQEGIFCLLPTANVSMTIFYG